MTKADQSPPSDSFDRHGQTERGLHEMLQESQRRQAEISSLLKASKAVLQYREFGDAARSIFDICKELIGATSGYVALLDDAGAEDKVLSLDAGGMSCTIDPALPMPIRGLCESAYRTGAAVYENDFFGSDWATLLPAGHARLENVLFAPLSIEGRAVGLLGIANKPGGFCDRDARMAEAFGELAAVALQNSRALEALETSEQRFRSVTQSASDAIVSVDISGNITYWNEAAQRMFGYTTEEILGKPLTRIMPAPLHAVHQSRIDRVVATGEWRILGRALEVTGVRRDGGEFPIELSLATWKNKEGTFFTGILRDVTEQKRAGEEIVWLARFPSENPSPVLRVARDGTLLYCNPAGQCLLNAWQCRVGTMIPGRWTELVQKALHTLRIGEAEIECEGQTFSLTVTPVPDAGYANVYAADITAIRRTNEAMQFSHRVLEIANQHAEMKPLLEEFVAECKAFTRCAAVGIRILDEDGGIPYQALDGFSREFCNSENDLSIKTDRCMCVYVVRGASAGDHAFYTEGGSFYKNTADPNFLAAWREANLQVRNACGEVGYESVALVPIRLGGKILGLIHIADPRPGAISSKAVESLEKAAMQLGTAIQRVRAEESLRIARDQLEVRVQQRTAELADANRTLQAEIVERVEAEKRLREQSRILEAFFAHAVTPLVFLDPQFNFLRVNESYAKACQRDVSDFVGRNHFEMYPSDAQAIFEEVVRTKTLRQALARPFVFPDHPEWGATYWDWTLVPVLDDRGEVDFLIFSLRDVTAQTRLEEAVLHAHVSEQQRIGQELHDGLGQELTGLGYLAKILQQKLRSKGLQEAEIAADLARGIPQVLGHVQSIVRGLVPLEVGADDLVPALKALTTSLEEQTGIACRVEADPEAEIGDDETAIQFYRIAQEAVTNAVKHARPEQVVVSLTAEQGRIVLRVRDDGVGLDCDPQKLDGSGMRIMYYRARAIGGTLDVRPALDGGTCITCSIPRG